MPTTQTQLFPPPERGSNLSKSDLKYLETLQRQMTLRLVDTSAGPYSEALPAAGLSNSSTAQSNQNQEIVYKKISSDANVFTLTGAFDGPLTLTAQNSFMRLKSNATNWYRVG